VIVLLLVELWIGLGFVAVWIVLNVSCHCALERGYGLRSHAICVWKVYLIALAFHSRLLGLGMEEIQAAVSFGFWDCYAVGSLR